ncbi:PD-(D/E)XK nuclease family protein [Marivirga sp. S37H4]|uniref:PD-(D/E)XK nuclease family protein n=1 Tax=Marivirga aurantiaca TaxID=2802615 RepID=A0A935CDH4_9BACT|nr:PD-(D/E)XK nuclease family protein [Marivirga aurantiaca]MBK6266923.1 PD-(D/E)XK nuclease family protein [Marivirga aurantiaca]
MTHTFLEEIAHKLYADLGESIADWQIIFPNRRAGLFFNRALRKLINKPIWAPEVMSIEDFVKQQSDFAVPDQLSLVFSLHEVFQKHAPFKENFEQFYFWGDLLVKDFNDVDHYMADARPLFANLSEWKQMANTDFLLPEQIALIERFWKSFEAKPKAAQEKFRRNWDILFPVYKDFKARLLSENKAYNGMLYREYTERLKAGKVMITGKLVFAGFNALTKTEEVIISEAVKQGAKVFWDIDAYYAAPEQTSQEAGNFFREYKKQSVLANTFPKEMPDRIIKESPQIYVTEVKGNIAQAKFLGQLLQGEALDLPEKTAIILGDESLLFPVLYALPKEVQKVNVTMGYPLRFASIYQLMHACLQLQKNKRGEKFQLSFNHRDVLKILKHPFVGNILKEAVRYNIDHIEKQNMIRVGLSDLKASEHLLNQLIFKDASDNYFSYLKQVLQYVHEEKLEATEQEFISEIYKHIQQLEKIVEQFRLELDINAFIRLFNRIIQSLRVPFSGEPLEGLQIMGVLESRNLDFENVYFLSMSEDNFPGGANTQSFIPYNIRKAYGLPTLEQRDAIYAYLFYRLLQRSKKLHLMYNSDNSGGKGGEPSRYLLQLKYELGVKTRNVHQQMLNQNPQAATAVPILIEKDDSIWKILNEYCQPGKRKLSASALKTYFNCRLQFYFRYIAGLKEKEEVSEELDAADFGNILHHVMEDLYKPLLGKKLSTDEITGLKKNSLALIEKEFHELYGKEGEKFDFEGRNIIIRDVVKRMVDRILDYDARIAPFTVLEVEEDGKYIVEFPLADNLSVFLYGTIDRLDQLGESIRVIDYKSGGDEVKFPDVPSLFDRDHPKRNGAAMQTLMYAYLYLKKSGMPEGKSLVPGLYNGKGLFTTDFSEKLKMGKDELTNALPLMDEFEEGLQAVLIELFASPQPFDQTDKIENCQYCEFRTICNR